MTQHHPALDARQLMDIVHLQTDIARLGLNLGGVADLVVRRAQAMTGASGAAIDLRDTDELVCQAASGIAEPLLGLRQPTETSLSGQCVHDGMSLYCADAAGDDRVDLDAAQLPGLRSLLAVPLMHGDMVVGALKVASTRASAFNDAHREMLELLSGFLAATMHHSLHNGTNELLRQATHDGLTQLPNRALFFDRFRQVLAQATRTGEKFGLLHIDLDGLKHINDEHGHHIGDRAVRELASRLRGVARTADTVARVAGDEFCVLLARVKDAGDAELACQRFRARIEQPFHVDGRTMMLGTCIGMAVYPDQGTSMETLLGQAERSLEVAKQSRRPMPADAARADGSARA